MSDRIKNIVQTMLFVFVLLIVFLFNIIKEDNIVSVAEKRKLQLMPDITFSSILDGRFSSEFDNYTIDQFFLREDLRKVTMTLDLNLKGEYHKLSIKDKYIYEKNLSTNINSVNNFISKINLLDEMYLNEKNKVYYTIIPDKNYFINNSYNDIHDSLIQNFTYKYIDIMSELKLDDYYKTDQHWKQENIKLVAKKILESMGKEYVDDYEEVFVKKFSGTYGNQITIFNEKDTLKILTSDTLNSCLVYNYDLNKESLVYDFGNMNIDTYNIYLSGPVSIISITNNLIDSNDELIIFRDSFTSSLAPLLVNQYKKITLIDTRYISPELIGEFIEIDNQDILFIYSTLIINNSYTLK